MTIAQPSSGPVAGPPDTWRHDPIQLALDQSVAMADPEAVARGDLPEPFCVDTGRRVLQAVLEFPAWVLRRVESVSFEEGRSVLRTMAIQFKVRDDAPVFEAPAVDGGERQRYWLVPLAIMNRRTLVEFHLRDEQGDPLTMPGLRLAQRLDESVLLAAAAASRPLTPCIRRFAQDVVAGPRSRVITAMEQFTDGRRGTQLAALRDDPLFTMALARWRYNFTLYAFLPVEAGQDRLLTMSFVEPIDWRFQRPELKGHDDGQWTYLPMQRAHFSRSHLASVLGWTPTRIRFQTPSAENAASYHFEVVAPKGVRIVEATLLAGRPHVPTERVSVDHVRADSLTIGLHAVEVRPNSLCRAQIHLRVQRAGWLTTLWVTTLAIAAVLGAVACHAVEQKTPDLDQDTNVIVLLITAAAAAATFIAQRDFPGVAARLVTWLRALGALAVALPVVAAGFLSFKDADPGVRQADQVPTPADEDTQEALRVLAVMGVVIFLVVTGTWLRTSWDQRRRDETSPWDMTSQTEGRRRSRRRRAGDQEEFAGNYQDALRRFRFSGPVVGVLSSEGWHSTYCWTDDHHRKALEALRALGSQDPPPHYYACAVPASCPHAAGNGCTVAARSAGSTGNGSASGGEVGAAAAPRS
jgi:hypothetical protein